jgi:hypothetical protein
VLVRAPTGTEDELQARLSALVATTLRERGLERAPGSGEIRVAALLVVLPHLSGDHAQSGDADAA